MKPHYVPEMEYAGISLWIFIAIFLILVIRDDLQQWKFSLVYLEGAVYNIQHNQA